MAKGKQIENNAKQRCQTNTPRNDGTQKLAFRIQLSENILNIEKWVL